MSKTNLADKSENPTIFLPTTNSVLIHCFFSRENIYSIPCKILQENLRKTEGSESEVARHNDLFCQKLLFIISKSPTQCLDMNFQNFIPTRILFFYLF